MEHKITVDFSIIESMEIKKHIVTIRAVCISGGILIVAAICHYLGICNAQNSEIMFLFLALSLVALCFILYKVESVQVIHAIEETKAAAALRRKLAEDAITREIKIQEKNISDAQKREHQKENNEEL